MFLELYSVNYHLVGFSLGHQITPIEESDVKSDGA